MQMLDGDRSDPGRLFHIAALKAEKALSPNLVRVRIVLNSQYQWRSVTTDVKDF
jgi:hypothetical protein